MKHSNGDEIEVFEIFCNMSYNVYYDCGTDIRFDDEYACATIFSYGKIDSRNWGGQETILCCMEINRSGK